MVDGEGGEWFAGVLRGQGGFDADLNRIQRCEEKKRVSLKQ